MRGTAVAVRVALLLAGCASVAGIAWWLAGPPLLALLTALPGRGGLGSLPLETVILGVCAAALLGCVAWLVAATTLTLSAYAARSVAPRSLRVARLGLVLERHCPRVTRRLVTATLGVALTTGLAGTALADPPPRPGLAGLTLPDRTTGGALSTTAPRTVALRPEQHPHQARPAGHVVVRPGDSLWRIAARLLPAHASDARITLGWHRLQDANPDRVGPDPDLIHPGTSLEVPRPLTPHRKDAP
jgi:LysM domain